ncbi:NUDIX hydrolase [Effusibacillus lacus]|uniref:NUDIX domain-containing protein n=1 Tax=Effusibacillus lacus TaxID=1348429 RepID=A0A292YL82_9BACL|nr:NUDIX domain-containing protein [Effusibacillus lacus]TCS68413.1 hypothetical protein EDD64_14324 [Effusibacillus lacus]GAX89669.1 NUDIX domain-containing protein [Effusibacillus lacus]
MAEEMKRASTILLIRNGDRNSGLEVYMTQRPETMLFLPGFHVFPGGIMESADRDERIHQFCKNRDLPVEMSYAVSAIRECFEEVGYLLADYQGRSNIGRTDETDRLRLQMENGELTFHDWVLSEQIPLRTDLIRYFGHRITPRAVSPRRFDTRYFLTIVPGDIELDPCQREVSRAEWIQPDVALEQAKKGTLKMVPPTMDALADLARFDSAEDAFAYAAGVGNPRPHELA